MSVVYSVFPRVFRVGTFFGSVSVCLIPDAFMVCLLSRDLERQCNVCVAVVLRYQNNPSDTKMASLYSKICYRHSDLTLLMTVLVFVHFVITDKSL